MGLRTKTGVAGQPRTRRLTAVLIALSGVVMAAPGAAQAVATTQATLLDRIQIEDLITSYYYNLGSGGGKAFGAYYTEDAILDINGQVARGHAAIEQAYRVLAAASLAQHGIFHMLLSNPLIRVQGDTATAEFLWTGILNEAIKAPPRFVEQGREYDMLVRHDGAWRIRKRTVIADSGLPDQFDKTYTPRRDYDPVRDPR